MHSTHALDFSGYSLPVRPNPCDLWAFSIEVWSFEARARCIVCIYHCRTPHERCPGSGQPLSLVAIEACQLGWCCLRRRRQQQGKGEGDTPVSPPSLANDIGQIIAIAAASAISAWNKRMGTHAVHVGWARAASAKRPKARR